jgi:hypothetical protein
MRFIIHVVVPVLIGVAAGVGVGIISVFVAEIVGGLLIRIRGRRAEPDYQEIRDVKQYDEEDELPQYEEVEGAPEYTDTDEKRE